MDTYFIGYDAREHEAAAVCAYSIVKRSKKRIKVYLLEHRALRRLGLFSRPWDIDSTGQFRDVRDARPFSTEFSHSRFLVFQIARELGCTGPCMFLDCDMLFLDNPDVVMREQDVTERPISLVMTERKPSMSTKMDGMKQEAYSRKLWSAMFTFTPSDILADRFNPDTVNYGTGAALHQFLNTPLEHFRPMDPRWHVIPTMDDYALSQAWMVHYSETNPWINPQERAGQEDFFDAWYQEREELLEHAGRTKRLMLVDNLEQDIAHARLTNA